MAAKLTAAEQLKKDTQMAIDEKNIQDTLIEVQTLMGKVTNKIDAFGREYESDVSNAQILIWAGSINGTSNKLKSASRSNLLKDGVSKLIKTKHHAIEVVWTTPTRVSLDTMKFKKMDPLNYDKVAKVYGKPPKRAAKVKIKEI